MSNHYIGLDLFDLENKGLRQPISRITLYRGDNAALTAGDDTGMEVVADCIYVTQEMVEALLSAARGYQYHAYSAQAARLNPAAELGDTVTVGSITSVLAQISDNGDLYPDIAAPGDREVEDEYPAAGPLTKAFDKKLAEARSEITKTTDEIQLAIYGEDNKGGLNGQLSTLKVSLNGITSRVEGLSGQYTEISQSISNLSIKVVAPDGKETSIKLSDGSINLNGMVTFETLGTAPQGTGVTKIDGGWINTDTLVLTDKLVFGDFKAEDEVKLTGAVKNAKDAIDGVDDLADGDYYGTFINGKTIYSPEIYAGMFYATGEGRKKGMSGEDAAYYVYDSYRRTKNEDGSYTHQLGNLVGYLSYDTKGEGTSTEAAKRVLLTSLSYKDGKDKDGNTIWVDIPIKIEAAGNVSIKADSGKIFMESSTQFSGGIILEELVNFGTIDQRPAASGAVNGQLFFVYE